MEEAVQEEELLFIASPITLLAQFKPLEEVEW